MIIMTGIILLVRWLVGSKRFYAVFVHLHSRRKYVDEYNIEIKMHNVQAMANKQQMYQQIKTNKTLKKIIKMTVNKNKS